MSETREAKGSLSLPAFVLLARDFSIAWGFFTIPHNLNAWNRLNWKRFRWFLFGYVAEKWCPREAGNLGRRWTRSSTLTKYILSLPSSAENHITLPNKLPFLPSTEKAGHFNFFFSQRTLPPHLTSPRLASPRLASPRLASPRLASPRLTSPHLTSPHLISDAME